MKTPHTLSSARFRQQGVTLVELMVAVAITMFLVAAAAYVYLGTRETQRAIDRTSSSAETGAFALQLIGREVALAGYYPSSMPPNVAGNNSGYDVFRYDTYPPPSRATPGPGSVPLPTDWINPSTASPNPYATGVFGCEGARFNLGDTTCGSAVAGAPDSIVINYFTNESHVFGDVVGQRRDCTGADVANDPSNATRRLNDGKPPGGSAFVTMNENLPPQAPLFVSNRYTLTAQTIEVEKQTINTKSLVCSGNGDGAYQSLLEGVEDLQFTYGVFTTAATLAPTRFYTATEVNALPPLIIEDYTFTPWNRVVAVRVCLVTRTLGANPKIADKTGSERTYLDCADQVVTQAASDTSIRKRHIQVFAMRNKLPQRY